MGSIEDVYADLDADVSEEEFREAVEAKVEQMGGLADEETAAMLIAHELAEGEVGGIADVEPGMEEVKFLGKVRSVGELREFDREGEEETGKVVNVELADETGAIRVAFWDDMAESAISELEPGQVLRVAGRPKEGYNGVEVSASRVEPEADVEIDVPVGDDYRIADLSLGLSDVTIRGRVLATDAVRTFDRDDGTEGRVSNLSLGDETGRVRVTIWDEKADLAEEFSAGESVEVIDGYVRDRDGDLELHVGNRGAIERIDDDVEYVPESTPIADLEIGETVDIAGVVRSADPVRTFDRDDGSEGQVRNVRVQDESGDVRVALWGDQADVDLGPGDEVQLADVEIKDGWQEELEASAGWRSTVTVLDDGSIGAPSEAPDAGGGSSGGGSGGPGLDAFAGESDDEPSGSDGPGGASGSTPGATGDAGSASAGSAAVAGADPGEEISFTGVVVQAGDPVVLDDGTETVALDGEADVELGQEVTVRGTMRDGRLDPDEVS